MSRQKNQKTSSKPGQSSCVSYENDNDEELSIFVNNIETKPKVLPAPTCGKAARRKTKSAEQNSNQKIKHQNLEHTSQKIDCTDKRIKNKEDLYKQQFAETEKKIKHEFNEAKDILRQIKAGNRLLQTDSESKSTKNTQSPTPCRGIISTSIEAENNYSKYMNSLMDLVYNLKNEIDRLKDENFKLTKKISEKSDVRQENSASNIPKTLNQIPCDACVEKQKIIDRIEGSLKKMQKLLNDKNTLYDKERQEYNAKITLLEKKNEELKKIGEDARKEKFLSECQNLEHLDILLDLERRSHDMLEKTLKEEIFKLKTECVSMRENVNTMTQELRRNHAIILELQYKNVELSKVSYFSGNILYKIV